MTDFSNIGLGFELTKADQKIVNTQKSITKHINDKFIQVGAVFLKPLSKFPIDESWFKVTRGSTDLQMWVDDPPHQPLNGGFNLQMGWVDVDIDSGDPRYNRLMLAALRFVGVDTRFRFGRRSINVATHVLVQLPEDETANYDWLCRFEPREIRLNGRHHTQIRSYGGVKDNIVKQAKQVVVPGSVYSSKHDDAPYDLSVWYTESGKIADDYRQVAQTTPRICSYFNIIKAVAFATIAYVMKDHWVEGSRQIIATKLTGWLARVVMECKTLAEQETVALEVHCPIVDDATAEKLIHFLCEEFGDDEPHMRIRAYYDAREKLERNPDAKVPGWISMSDLLGGEAVQALRSVITPGADVSKLTAMAERYIYDETDNTYIDRTRHSKQSLFVHEGGELERRHKGDTLFLGGKPREAFKVFESSNIRKRVDFRDMYPEIAPGTIIRVNKSGIVVPDEFDGESSTIFNTWQGWQVEPVTDAELDQDLMKKVTGYIDKMFMLLTSNNSDQSEWLKDWLAWTRKYPGVKQQIAAVLIGGQGVGKSFWGHVFCKALFGARLWTSISAKVVDDKFNIGPFLSAMFAFIDEAKFTGEGATEEVKKLIRNTDMGGMLKYEEARSFRVFARLAFASNVFNMNIAQRNTEDRALFYIRATSAQSKGMTEAEFKNWAFGLKPFYDEFQQLINDEKALRHIIRYFTQRNPNRYEVESLSFSSGNDPDVLMSNMSWPRRVAKTIIESGYINDPMTSFDMPFTIQTLSVRIQDATKELGMRGVSPDAVLAELRMTGLLDGIADGNHKKNYLRFNRKWGDVVKSYTGVIGVQLSPYRQLGDNDYGENTATNDKPVTRIGSRSAIAGSF